MGIHPKDFWELSNAEFVAATSGWADEQEERGFVERVAVAQLTWAAGTWKKGTDLFDFLGDADKKRLRALQPRRKTYSGTIPEQIAQYKRDRAAMKNGNGVASE